MAKSKKTKELHPFLADVEAYAEKLAEKYTEEFISIESDSRAGNPNLTVRILNNSRKARKVRK
jgi:hypothetical protein